jgi:hypothetical protein
MQGEVSKDGTKSQQLMTGPGFGVRNTLSDFKGSDTGAKMIGYEETGVQSETIDYNKSA